MDNNDPENNSAKPEMDPGGSVPKEKNQDNSDYTNDYTRPENDPGYTDPEENPDIDYANQPADSARSEKEPGDSDLIEVENTKEIQDPINDSKKPETEPVPGEKENSEADTDNPNPTLNVAKGRPDPTSSETEENVGNDVPGANPIADPAEIDNNKTDPAHDQSERPPDYNPNTKK